MLSSTTSQQSFHKLFLMIALLSIFFFASFSHAQTTTLSNDQMSVECGYQSVNGEMTSTPAYCVKVSLKKPSELNAVTTLQAPAISVPLHAEIILTVDGHASSQEESYGFFQFSQKNYFQDEILTPGKSSVENFCNEKSEPNIAGIIDGDSYTEQSASFPDFARAPLIGSWFDNLKDNQLKEVPCISSWHANQEGTADLKLEGNIGCDKKESLIDYSGWKWNPKHSVTLELPITIVSEQD